MAAILRDSTVVVVVVVVVVAAVVRTRPRAIPLAMTTMRKSTHGFPFVSHICFVYGAPLGGPSGRRSSAINARNLGLVGVVGQASLLGISAETVGLLRNVLQREQQGSRQSRGLKFSKWVSTLMPLAPSAVVLRMIQSVATRMIIEVMTDFC